MTWGRKKERRQLASNYLVFSDVAEGLQREPTWEEARLSQHTEVLQVVANRGSGNPALLAVLLRALKAVQAVSIPSPQQQGMTGHTHKLPMFWKPRTEKATPPELSLKAAAATALRLLQTLPRAGSQLPQLQGRGENLPLFRGYWEFPNLSSKWKSWGDQIKWKLNQGCSSFLVTTAHNLTLHPDLTQLQKQYWLCWMIHAACVAVDIDIMKKLLCRPAQWLKIETKIYNNTIQK